MVYTEFVSSDALVRSIEKQCKLETSDEERPVSFRFMEMKLIPWLRLQNS